MAERYTRLSSLPENQYTVGSPILIAAGALLKDNQTGKALAQIKFKSISDKQIKAIKISISAFDVSGKELEGVAEYQYLDLTAARTAEFGHKQAVTLPDAVTRSIEVKCTDVFFVDGTVWNAAPNAVWTSLPTQKTVTAQLGNLAAQYQRDTSYKSKFIPLEYEDLWFCSCGAVNHDGETQCHNCRHSKTDLFDALDMDTLQQRDAAHRAAEAEKAEKQAEEERIRNASAKKYKSIVTIVIGVIIIVTAVVFLITNVLIPSSKYNNAIALMNEGKYEEAIAIFDALVGYKDSEVNMTKCGAQIIAKDRLEELLHADTNDTVFFGNYEQDNNHSNGKEAIEWIVLKRADDKLYLVSRYALDCKPYNTTLKDVTWETCTLRKWLNSDFLSNAFSLAEESLISTVTVEAEMDTGYSTNQGNATQDKVFLRGITDPISISSSGQATDYAVANGAYRSDSGYTSYWFRTIGLNQFNAFSTNIVYDMHLLMSDTSVNVNKAIFPVICIDLSVLD